MNPRQRVPLGRTGLSVTRLGLGTAPLGGLYRAVSDDEGHAVVERAWALGMRLFDTAPLYGSGLAERRLGDVLRTRPRSELTLATKVGRLLRPGAPPDAERQFEGAPPLHPEFDFSAAAVGESLVASLERLRLDRVDILHLHDPDAHHDEALALAYPALDRLRAAGTISAVGAGMNKAAMLARLAREADFDCFLLAGRYTLLDQAGLEELLPLCERRGVAVIAGGVLNSGILAGPGPGATFDYRPAPPALIERARAMEAVCERHGVPLTAAALQFPLGHPAVASVLVGCRSAAEVEENVRLFEMELPGELWRDLRAEGLLPAGVPVP